MPQEAFTEDAAVAAGSHGAERETVASLSKCLQRLPAAKVDYVTQSLPNTTVEAALVTELREQGAGELDSAAVEGGAPGSCSEQGLRPRVVVSELEEDVQARSDAGRLLVRGERSGDSHAEEIEEQLFEIHSSAIQGEPKPQLCHRRTAPGHELRKQHQNDPSEACTAVEPPARARRTCTRIRCAQEPRPAQIAGLAPAGRRGRGPSADPHARGRRSPPGEAALYLQEETADRGKPEIGLEEGRLR